MEPPLTIICFSGVDWHSHRQRPHWLMTAFAERGAHVLFVDNLGTRLPRLRDARRIAKRLAEWVRTSRGPRAAGPARRHRNILVDSPVVLPMQQLGPVRALGRATLVRRLRRRIRPGGPLIVWTYLPLPAIGDAAESLGADLLVYDWSDDASEHVLSRSARQRRRIGVWEEQMAARADVVFVASAELLRSRGTRNPNTHLMPHGSPRRSSPGRDRPPEPPEVAHLARPRIGLVGSISDWIDLELLEHLARERPRWSFVMVGPVKTRVKSLRRYPNVTFVGDRPHEEVPGFLGAFDVGIIPYRVTPATTAASPLKLREYLAHGLPVVSVDVPEVRPFAPPVRLAADPAAFLSAIEAALKERRRRRAVPRTASWDERAEEMLGLVAEALAAPR